MPYGALTSPPSPRAQVADLPSVVATLLDAGERPYQLSLNPAEGRRDVASPQQDLDFGIGTIFCNDPDGNVVEFVDVTRGIFATTNYKLEAA